MQSLVRRLNSDMKVYMCHNYIRVLLIVVVYLDVLNTFKFLEVFLKWFN